jgi:hypothetical protein
MGEILVARGKRRRSAAPGCEEQKETVRAKMIFKELTFFRTELRSRSEMKLHISTFAVGGFAGGGRLRRLALWASQPRVALSPFAYPGSFTFCPFRARKNAIFISQVYYGSPKRHETGQLTGLPIFCPYRAGIHFPF